MALSNYTDLKASVANWLHRNDLTALIPDFIALAESYLNDDLRVRSMITDVTVTPSQSVSYVALPDGFIEAIAFVDANGDELIQVHHDKLKDISYASGTPEYYSVTSRINFECVASSALSYTMTYYKGLDLATDGSNTVLTDYPNLYLYGTLLQAEMYLKNDKRVSTWHELYSKALQQANRRNADSLTTLKTDHPSVGQTFDITRG